MPYSIKNILSYTGLGFLVAVGYMDPGNWATDISGGSKFGYLLLSVILISGFMAILLQYLSLKLGIATGKDLAQICKVHFSAKTNFFLWILNEIGIIACDIAEVIGCAIALELLFSISMLFGVVLTVLDTFIILFLTSKNFRHLEIFVTVLIFTIFSCFLYNIILIKPNIMPILKGFIPSYTVITNPSALFIAVGILGATVMPHNLYLHSSLVKGRKKMETLGEKKIAVRFASIDSFLSLLFALLINAFILILAASSFHVHGKEVNDIKDAYYLLAPILGTTLASILFAVALLASGQNSTITGTLAGQIIMEGFINIKLKPWLRRLITRSIAILPVIIVIMVFGEKSVDFLLILSQVILSLVLPFSIVPLVRFTNKKSTMGYFANKKFIKGSAYISALIIIVLNLYLVLSFLFNI